MQKYFIFAYFAKMQTYTAKKNNNNTNKNEEKIERKK